ncbi:RagB/SusD family nutrient uptake outer membrane protein [Chitinophaga arvensicola]|uniref:Starch-binding associating with outer membrane n=1 Tax=Chitinophaga arvensicola TaxID=29529 RepID=A0A1I0RQ42_9BACT|nr:RagB/SusD family nutrient uptake outer membrane protein [Chitinophaga arvensicola]SEW43340.1 Starch-binding associating with outer membrane [Chitinophaga arvensicola]
MKFNIAGSWIVGGMILFSSCAKDILDKKPKDSISEVTVWNDMGLVSNYITYFYSTMQSGYARNWYSASATDDGLNALNNDPFKIRPLTTDGSWNANNSPFTEYYTSIYQNMRRVNDFLAHIDAVPGDDVQRSQLKAEARFFRAYYYTELINYFSDDPITASGATMPSGVVPGIENALGVVILEKAQVYGNDSLAIPRSTKGQCVDYVVSELDAVADALGKLPASSLKDAGRITPGAALGLKARTLLYMGRFKAAAAAARVVMDLKIYSLYPDYATLFTVKNNAECIISVQHNNIAKERGHFYDRDMAPGSLSGISQSNPTQNLVDEYEMTDGKMPSESPLFDPKQPYANRDRRFNKTIAYDGATYRGSVLQFYEGGFDLVNAGSFKTQTRYVVRKAINENFNFQGDATLGSDQNWQLLRYAEILMNYAEAQNEDAGPDQSVYDAVNAIRRRAGQPDLPAGLSQSGMRQRIRHERRIEFAFEDQRFWDLRRWHIADQLPYKSIYGITITKAADGSKIYSSEKLLESRVFELRNYCFPIPASELLANKKMVQNTYWK